MTDGPYLFAFVERVSSNLPPTPPNFARIADLNGSARVSDKRADASQAFDRRSD